ncbi:MAG: HD domain-containing protein [Bacteroidota bacterium]
MSNTIPLDHPIFPYITQAASELGVDTYVVGGYVRDLLMHGPTKKDIDFVCIGSGIELAEKTAALIDPKLKVHTFKNYGTAMFHVFDTDIEFVGARKESYQRESRNPIVENGTLEDDQNRRDFTINALAISVNKDNFGTLIDPFDGIADIEKGIIRTPQDATITFSDDPLRMLRAIRFATVLQFSIEQKTLEAIHTNKERIKIISQERITEELNKIILSKNPSIGFNLLFDTGLLAIIFPEMQALHGTETINELSHKDNFYHTLKVLDNVCEMSDNLWLRWSAILHDIAKPPTKRFDPRHGWTFHGHEFLGSKWVPGIFKRMKLPLDAPMRYVQKLVLLHLRPISLTKENITDAAIRRLLFEAADDIDDLMILCRADITSKNKMKVKRYLENFDIVEKKIVEIEAKDHIRNFQPPISGELIMETFGIKPSKPIGEIKNYIKDAILDGIINNDFEQAYQLMLEKGESLGLIQVHGNS